MTLDKRKGKISIYIYIFFFEKGYQFILVTSFDSRNLKYSKVNNVSIYILQLLGKWFLVRVNNLYIFLFKKYKSFN